MLIADTTPLRSLSTTMKSLRFHGTGDLRLDDLSIPNPGRDEVLIRPLAAGLCGTDEHILHGHFPAAAPVVLGHEVAGIIEAVGSNVENVKAGDLVTVQPNTYCGLCRYCREGREHLCTQLRAYGVHLNGGFSQAMIARASAVYPLPGNTDPRIGCLAEPLACCIHGMDRAAIRSGDSVLVIGAGLIGLMLTRLARLACAGRITVSELQAQRRALAGDFGADELLDPAINESSAQTNGCFDVVIDAVGSPATFEHAVRNAGRGATVLVFGVAAQNATAQLKPYEIYARELTVVGSFINPYTHGRAVELLPQMHLDRLPLRSFPLSAFQAAFQSHAESADPGKVVILPQE